MKILLIEDDNLKFELIIRLLKEVFPESCCIRSDSYQSGIEKLVNSNYDYVFLDMSLPVSDLTLSPVGVEWLTFGGQYILRECQRRRIFAKIIVISQYGVFIRNNEEITFDQLRVEILSKYQNIAIGCVHLDRASHNWKKEIKDLMNQ